MEKAPPGLDGVTRGPRHRMQWRPGGGGGRNG